MTDWWNDVPSVGPLGHARRVAEKAQLVALVAAGGGGRRVSTPVRVAGVGVAVVAAAAAGITAYNQADVTDTSQVRCHTTLDPGEGPEFAGATLMLASSSTTDAVPPVDEPVRACAELWRAGVLELGEETAGDPENEPRPVPPLVGCVGPDGAADVFPSTDRAICSQLGLRIAR